MVRFASGFELYFSGWPPTRQVGSFNLKREFLFLRMKAF